MCGRFVLSTPVTELGRLFGFPERPHLGARFNIAPTQDIAVIRYLPEEDRRELALVRWGLVPFWSEDPSIGQRLINARAESARTKPAFRQAFKQRRCVIPADGFYEWKPVGKRKQPFHIRNKSGNVMAFAGLWERWTGPKRSSVEVGSGDDRPALDSATILTTQATGPIAALHDRMPVLLSPDAVTDWLDPNAAAQDLEALLLRTPVPELAMRAVSPKVNTVRLDGPELIEPVPEQPDLF